MSWENATDLSFLFDKAPLTLPNVSVSTPKMILSSLLTEVPFFKSSSGSWSDTETFDIVDIWFRISRLILSENCDMHRE